MKVYLRHSVTHTHSAPPSECAHTTQASERACTPQPDCQGLPDGAGHSHFDRHLAQLSSREAVVGAPQPLFHLGIVCLPYKVAHLRWGGGRGATVGGGGAYLVAHRRRGRERGLQG